MAKIYKGAFSGTLPITVSGTGTGVLASYRIFGNDGGVGVETEASGYKLPILSNSVVTDIYIGDTTLAKDEYVDSATGKIYRRTKNLSPPEEEWIDGQIWGDGTIHPSTEIKTSPFIDVSTCETCIMEVFSAETEWAAAGYREMAFYDKNKQYLGWIGGGGRQALTPRSSERLSEFPAGTVYVRIGCSHGDQPFYPQLVSGYTPTHQFYPYLIPTDPPAPFPQIPTVAGTTVIDYAGTGLAPSQFDGVAGWGNLPVRKLKGVPYTGTLPATLTGTKAGYLYKYEVYGNTEQDSGTPTPENPIVPSGCGERTGNLFNVNRLPSDTWTIDDKYYIDGAVGDSKSSIRPDTVDVSISNSGDLTVIARSYYGAGFVIPVTPNTTYTISFTTDTAVPSSKSIATITYINADEDFLQYITIYGGTTSVTFTTPNTAYYILITFRYTSNTITYSDIMLSSTALPYEPYGYKLPILSNSTVTNIYLGEVETTRRIKKLVLNGTEPWYASSNKGVYYMNKSTSLNPSHLSGICTRFVYHFVNSVSNLAHGEYLIDQINKFTWFRNNDITNLQDWKAWLAQQYAAGTPVTVWYVLAKPETAVVNEPLMKIGDYADTIDSTQTSVQIPTSAGSTTISWAGEGLAPSQFDSIQEWVDIPTYTYTNGAWVADN